MKFGSISSLLIVTMSFYSCIEKQKSETKADQRDEMEWVEMDSFHLILAEAFYPYKDSANLEPVKRLAVEMAQEAENWTVTSLPEKVNNDQMKATLNQLNADTHALSALIKAGASDVEIGTSLLDLHESFHGIMETWKREGMNQEY